MDNGLNEGLSTKLFVVATWSIFEELELISVILIVHRMWM